MISVLIECLDEEAHLAKTLGALIPGAIEGLIAEVVVIDRSQTAKLGGDPNSEINGVAHIADAAGCIYCPSENFVSTIEGLRGQWVMMIEAGAKPLNGWIETTGEHISNSNKPARMSLSKRYRQSFLKRLFHRNSPLEHILLIPKNQFLDSVKTHQPKLAQKSKNIGAAVLPILARGFSARRLTCEVVTASYARAIQ